MRVSLLDLDICVYHCSSTCSNETNFDTVKYTVDQFIRGWIAISGGTHYMGFLTDSPQNFRETRAITLPYKGDRKFKDKPSWYPAIRDYVIAEWKAQLMVGVEADDALAIMQTHFNREGIESVIVTEDKDLLQVPGLHYNKTKSDTVFRLNEEQCHKLLWEQVITGDRVDNIPGVSHAISETTTGSYNLSIKALDIDAKEKLAQYKRLSHIELYGPKGAESYLSDYPPEEWPARVWELYVDKYEDPLLEDSRGTERFYETFDLIYMLREKPEDLELSYEIHEVPTDHITKLFDFY